MVYIKRWIEHYEDLFAIEEGQKEFFESYASKFPQPAKLLNIECGPATLSESFTDKYDVTVADQYQEFIDIVKSRNSYNEGKIHAFNLHPMDFSRYLGKNFFDVVYCLNYRVIFLKERILIKKYLIDAKMALSEGGYLILDLINFAKYDFSQTKIDLPEKKCDRGTLYSSLVKNSESPSYRLYQNLVTASGKVIDEVKDEVVCPVSLETFKTAAEEMKFSSIDFYSDYKKTPYFKDSDKIICVLKK